MRKEVDFLLKEHNSLGVDAIAKEIYFVDNEEELQELAKSVSEALVIGSATNILFVCPKVEKPIICPLIMGLERVFDNHAYTVVSAGAGEEWQALVDFSLAENLGGIENLSLIPGKVGAAPIQNIGAYGVELQDVFFALEAVELGTGKIHTFHKEMCEFAYRDSVFKNKLKDKYVITRVFLKFEKEYSIKTQYGGLQMHLNAKSYEQPTIQQMAEVVNEVRQSKLPYPEQIPNAGSFFKNPIISKEKHEKLKVAHSFVPHYDLPDEMVKIPAAWLIEQCGYKGHKQGRVGVYENHALILVNLSHGTGQEIVELAEKIIESVIEKFGIELSPEVRFIY